MHRFKTLLVTASAIALTSGTVSAASARMHFVPSSRVVVLTGHGFGHGIGMSQYGAEGAARQGKNHRQILRFYYPGTTIARAADQPVGLRLDAPLALWQPAAEK